MNSKKLICILISVTLLASATGFVYWRWGWKEPEMFDLEQTYVLDSFAFELDAPYTIPSKLLHPAPYYTDRKAVVLPLTITNLGKEARTLNEGWNFYIDQFNDPYLLKKLNIHFYENLSTREQHDLNFQLQDFFTYTFTPHQPKQCFFVFYYNAKGNEQYVLNIENVDYIHFDWKHHIRGMIESRELTTQSIWKTDNFQLKPLSIFQDDQAGLYGLTVSYESFSDTDWREIQVVAMQGRQWEHVLLDEVTIDETRHTVTYYAPAAAGIGEFYLRWQGDVVRWVVP